MYPSASYSPMDTGQAPGAGPCHRLTQERVRPPEPGLLRWHFSAHNDLPHECPMRRVVLLGEDSASRVQSDLRAPWGPDESRGLPHGTGRRRRGGSSATRLAERPLGAAAAGSGWRGACGPHPPLRTRGRPAPSNPARGRPPEDARASASSSSGYSGLAGRSHLPEDGPKPGGLWELPTSSGDAENAGCTSWTTARLKRTDAGRGRGHLLGQSTSHASLWGAVGQATRLSAHAQVLPRGPLSGHGPEREQGQRLGILARNQVPASAHRSPTEKPGDPGRGPFSFRPGVSEHALTPSRVCEQGGVLTPFHARKPLAGADRPGRPAEPVSPRSCPRKRRQPSPAHLVQMEIFRRFFPNISPAVSKGQSKEREPVGGSSGGSPSFGWSAETGSCGDALGSKKQRPVPAAARPARASALPPPPLPSRAPKSHYHIPLQCGPTFLEQSEISR